MSAHETKKHFEAAASRTKDDATRELALGLVQLTDLVERLSIDLRDVKRVAEAIKTNQP